MYLISKKVHVYIHKARLCFFGPIVIQLYFIGYQIAGQEADLTIGYTGKPNGLIEQGGVPPGGMIQGSHGDWKTWKMKMVMEKSCNMKNWPKIMEFCDHSWNYANFVPKFYQICVTAKKLSRNLESPHFLTLSAK